MKISNEFLMNFNVDLGFPVLSYGDFVENVHIVLSTNHRKEGQIKKSAKFICVFVCEKD